MSELNDKTNVGEQPTQDAPFRTFATQEEFDNFSAHLIKKAEEKALKNAKVSDGEILFDKKAYEAKYRKDLEAQIRSDIEKQAKMTEAEKLAEERKQLQEQIKQERIEINRDRARNLLLQAGYEEEDLEVYLDFVNEDREVSLGRIKRVCESRKQSQEKLKNQLLSELKQSNPNISVGTEEANDLQKQYDRAIAVGNLALASALTRQAQSKGITLKNKR